jgi:hypothetical protein
LWFYVLVLFLFAKQHVKFNYLVQIRRYVLLQFDQIFSNKKQKNKTLVKGWGCSLVVEHLPSLCQALGSISAL